MLNNIITASANFCIHQIREPHKIIDTIPNKKTIIVYIDIETNNIKKYRIYLASDFNFMQRISYIFLEETDCDEQTLVDMALETANLIIGSAKVIAEDENKNTFIMKTPHFVKIDKYDLEYDDFKVFKIGDDELLISIKELS